MRVVRTGAALGAEIHDVDFSADVAAETVDGIHRALLDHQVVVLRAPNSTVDRHVALAERFGEPEVHAFFPNLGGGHERVSVLDSEDGTRASMWHADETFLERLAAGDAAARPGRPRVRRRHGVGELYRRRTTLCRRR
ncbi:TauD/TfdA dioxygenase family protein [Yinghuangia aomiensis]